MADDLRAVLRRVSKAATWRNWLAVGFFDVIGVLFVVLALSEDDWNQDITAAFVMGVISIACRPGEVVWVYDLELAVRGRPSNVWVCTRAGERLRVYAPTHALRDELVAAIERFAPGRFEPLSKERERAFKANPAA